MPYPHKITASDALQRTIEHREIFHDEMLHLMRLIMGGEMSPVMMAALITGLRVKKETIGEITAAAQVMREFSTKVNVLGVNINVSPEAIARCIDEVGIGFMFAPSHHPAMKAVAPIRKELGVRTIFNILGPLTNPASAPNILMGVFHSDLVGIQIRALQRLGAEHALVVYGKDGLDEISLGAATVVGELKNGEITEYEIHPEDFGFTMASSRALRVDEPEQSKAMLLGVLGNEAGPARDIVILNAGAALYAANVAGTMKEGIDKARGMLASGAARTRLEQLVKMTNEQASCA